MDEWIKKKYIYYCQRKRNEDERDEGNVNCVYHFSRKLYSLYSQIGSVVGFHDAKVFSIEKIFTKDDGQCPLFL